MSFASDPQAVSWNETYDEIALSVPEALRTGATQAFVVQNYAFVLEACGPIAGKRVLDVGFGNGDLARILDRMGGHVTAFDVVSTRISQLREEAPTVAWWQDDISTWKQPRHAEPFDLIVACETLQFVEFYSAVRRFMDVLADQGRMVILIPNADCPVAQQASQDSSNGISIKSFHERLRGLAENHYVAYRAIHFHEDAEIGPYRSGPWRQILPEARRMPTPHYPEGRMNVPHRFQVVIVRSGDS